MLSSVPIQASAELLNLTNESSTESLLNEALEPVNVPDGQTIILPLMGNSEGERKDLPGEKVENTGLMRLSFENTNMVYAPTGVNSYQINGYIYLDTTIEPVPGSMLQIIAADGETILAYSSGIDYYFRDYETGYYCIDNIYITMLQEIPAGTYSMQLVAGEEKIPVLTNIVFTDKPLLAYVGLNNFSDSSDTCEVYVNLYNPSDELPEQLTFSLLDLKGNIVGQTSGLYRQLNNYGKNQISGYTLMNIIGNVSQNEFYRLAITYSGEGSFIDGTGGFADYIYVPSSDLYPEITDFIITDPMTSEAKVYAKNLDASSFYILTIRDDYYGRILYQSTVSGANSPFTVNLTFNGLTVPISVFDAWSFYVQIQRVESFGSHTMDFINPYYNDQHPISFNFDPYFINPNTTELPFTIRIYNAGNIYHGETDFTISVKTGDGTELASIAGDKTTIVRYGDEYEISGTLNFSSLPNLTDLFIFFNTDMIDYVYVTDAFLPYHDYLFSDWTSKTFWLMMDQLYLKTDVINSSGTANLVLKDENGAVVAESGVVTGTTSKYNNHLNYEFILTPQLENGQKYSLVMIDGEKEYEFFSYWENDTKNDYFIYDGEFSFDYKEHFYLGIYDLCVGDTWIEGEISAWNCKNMTSDYLSNFLKGLVLKNDEGNVIPITGFSNGRFSDYRYYFDVMLSLPLTAGNYTITYPDGDEISFTVEPPLQDKTPMIYGNNAGDGFVYGINLPTETVYTGKIYQGYNCLTNEPFRLTLYGENKDNSVQYLYIPNDIIGTLTEGIYTLRIYMDGVFLDSVTLIKTSKQIVISAYDPVNESNGLLSTSGYVSFIVSDLNKYKQLRFSEDPSELSSIAYEEYSYKWYELSPGDGEKDLFVQLKDNEGNESGIFYLKIYRLVDTLPALYIHEAQQGVYVGNNVTLLLGADTQYLDAFVDFINPEGIRLATAQLDYKGLGEVPAFGNSEDVVNQSDGNGKELKYIFSSSFSITGWNNKLDWNYDYFDRLGIELSLKDTMFVRFYLGTGSIFKRTILSDVTERFLVFGSPENIIMPQFSPSNQYSANDRNVTLRGFATPNSTVTLNAANNQGQGFTAEVQANQYGYFTYTIENIDEGEYILTVTDDRGLSLESTYKIIIDRTPPTIAWLRFIKVDHQNVAVQWVCLGTDVSEFRLYLNGAIAATITNTFRTEYNRNILARYGDSFRLIAVDRLGNITVITREIGDKDDSDGSAVLSCPASVVPGDSFEVGIDLYNLYKPVYAQDITLTYDSDLFEYLGASSVSDDIKILREDTSAGGTVRLIAANIGGISDDHNRVFILNFKVKDGIENASGNIAITSAILGFAPEGKVRDASVDNKTISVYTSVPVDDIHPQ